MAQRGSTRALGPVAGALMGVAAVLAAAEARAQAPAPPPSPSPARPAPDGPAKNPATTAPARPGPAAPTPPAPAFASSAADAARTPPLQPDRPVTVNLRRGQQAFFRVAPDAGEAWAVTTRRLGRNTDTVLAVLNENGEVVTEDDDGGQENLASRVEVQPGDGARLVRAGVLEDAGGRFEVVLTREAVLPPPNFATTQEDAANRPPLATGQAVRVRLRRNQQAFFRLPDDRTDLIAITRELAGNTDTALALIDSSGRVLAENDDSERGLASTLAVSRAAEGPLFVRASLVNEGPGTFEVMLEREAPLPPPDYPTTLEAARARGPVSAGQTIHIELAREGQAVFALPEGQALTLLTRNLSDNADTVLTLLDAAGEQVAEDDDSGGGVASRLSTSAASRPAAFVRATLLNGVRGSFELAIQGVAEAAPGGASSSLAEAARRPTLLLGEAVRIRLESGGEVFVALPYDGRPAQAMTYDLEAELDTELALVDENGAVLAENDDAEGLASRLDVPPTPRPAFLRVKLVDDKAGSFSLVLVRPAP
ncbi:hypothetical protein [Roseomonas indoligenes]|uniref:Uncharacterized protein n=1 Tax=Roseomonas indoligenes TaxID=2820811 RepID=A0A940MUN5_9PROT|nr:hypothetical protein [Pararoseomonas indoligenes]MBP0492306.1 hypothetical protein [Pararoseomonas indoligenes]